jgi:hypothetical protein
MLKSELPHEAESSFKKASRVHIAARRCGSRVAALGARAAACDAGDRFLMPASIGRLVVAPANVSTKAAKAATSTHRVSHNALYFHDFIKTPCAPSENSAAPCEVLHTSKVDLDGIII